MTEFTDYPNSAMTSKVTAELITHATGVLMTNENMAVMRYNGTGPAFFRYGKKPLYRMNDVRSWLEARMGMTVEEAVACGRMRIPEGFTAGATQPRPERAEAA
jgi:hypothetical protein